MKRFLSLILAVTMLLSLVSIASADDLPTITIMFHGSNVSDDSAVLEKVNEYIADKVGAKLEVIWGTWGDFDDKATNALVSGDSGVDMVFTCSWSADEYNTFAKNGYFLKLDDLIAQYGADLVAAIPEALMQAATIEGAGFFKRFVKIVFPLSKGGFISGFMLIFVSIMKELDLIILIMTPKTSTLPYLAFQYQNQNCPQASNCVAIVMFSIVFLVYALANIFGDADLAKSMAG